MKKIAHVAFASIVSLTSITAEARLQDEGWIFTPIAGLSKPNIDIILNDIYVAPFAGSSEITTDLPEDVAGNSRYPPEKFHFENELPAQNIGVEAGFEVRRNFGIRNDFFVGISSWEVSSRAVNDVVLPLQGDRINDAEYERRAKFSYTQYFIGMRRYLFERSKRFNLYLNFSVHELFDVDYKETNVFSFRSGKPKGFKRIAIFKSQSTGLMLFQVGGGTEFQFADRFSLSLEGAYALPLKEGALRGVTLQEDFNDGDRLNNFPNYLSIDQTTGVALVTDHNGERKEIKLSLEGWRVLAKFNVGF